MTLTSLDFTNAGNYSVAITAAGGSTTSSVVSLMVVANQTVSANDTPIMGRVASNLDGSFTLNLAGAPGSTYILETTTNLGPVIIWMPIATNTLDATGVWQFTDLQATNFQQQFYRLELKP